MPKSTKLQGELLPLKDCYVNIPGAGKIIFRILPEISDSKRANYNTESILGRSNPIFTYSHSEARQINIQMHFVVDTADSITRNLRELRWIESAVYTRNSEAGAPFVPPPVCAIKCGSLLAISDGVGVGASTGEICAVLTNYTVKFPTDVAWDSDSDGETYCPYKFDIDTNWEVVYSSDALPGQERIAWYGV